MPSTIFDLLFRKLHSPVVVGLPILFCLSMVLTSPSTAQTYTVTDLGVLPGDTSSLGAFLNSSGQVTGCSDTTTGNTLSCEDTTPGHAFLWSSGRGLQDLGTLPGGTFSTGSGISDSGQVSGWSTDDQGAAHGFRWTASTGMTDLGTLPGGTYGYGFSINSSGVICGFGDSATSRMTAHVIIWTPANQALDLGSLPDAIANEALFIDAHNQVVGASLYLTGNFRAFVVTQSSGIKALPTLPGATTSIAAGDNDAGIIVGSSNSAQNSNGIAVAWDTHLKIHNLGTLSGDSSSGASSINDLDQVVGGSTTPSGISRAVLWTKSGGIQDLNNRIPPTPGGHWLPHLR